MSSKQDHTEGSRPRGPSSLIDQVVDQLRDDAPPVVVLGGTEQECLLQALATVPDPRDPRGVRHELAGLLAMTVAGALAGPGSFYAIGQWLADAWQRTLKRLGARACAGSGRYGVAEEATLRRLAGQIDAEVFEAALSGWLSGRVRRQQAARARRGRKPARTTRRVKAKGQRRARRGGHRPPLPQVAVDGKVVCGAKRKGGRAPHLLAAATCAGVVLAQRQVANKSNEIPAFTLLLEPLEISGMVVSADALHTQRRNATFLREDKHAHFVFPVLGNQPNLFAQLDVLGWGQVPVAARTEEHDRGRHEVRTIRVLDAPEGVLFPHVAQVFLLERQITQDRWTSYESVLYITSLSADKASPEDLLAYVRAHWTIENRVHWVRDVTLGEDTSQVRTGNAPRVLAAIRNLVISHHQPLPGPHRSGRGAAAVVAGAGPTVQAGPGHGDPAAGHQPAGRAGTVVRAGRVGRPVRTAPARSAGRGHGVAK